MNPKFTSNPLWGSRYFLPAFLAAFFAGFFAAAFFAAYFIV
jgi:hypothetical protein